MYLNKDYSFLSKTLHHLALGSNIIPEMLLDIEMAVFKKKLDKDNLKPHVFVSGLPRSGTTLLMRSLYETNQFASLTYEDMPFILSPNLWNKITGRKIKSYTSKERAHGDNIEININSPEAFDEIFWRVKLKNKYILTNKLILHEADDDIIEDFRNFVSLLLYKYKKKLYLSKNNNNLLRLGSIIKSFPNCLILIPFRDPVQQANSLLIQHKNFTQMQNQNKFVKNYMSYLVHYEFGVNHRQYEFIKNSKPESDNNSLEYWLTQWINTYTFFSQEKFSGKSNIMYVNYEYLCENPQRVFENIRKKINLDNLLFDNNYEFKLSFKKVELKEDQLVLKARKIFDKLKRLNNV